MENKFTMENEYTRKFEILWKFTNLVSLLAECAEHNDVFDSLHRVISLMNGKTDSFRCGEVAVLIYPHEINITIQEYECTFRLWLDERSPFADASEYDFDTHRQLLFAVCDMMPATMDKDIQCITHLLDLLSFPDDNYSCGNVGVNIRFDTHTSSYMFDIVDIEKGVSIATLEVFFDKENNCNE